MRGQRRRARGWIVAGALLVLLAAVSWSVISWFREPKRVPPDEIVRVERGKIARSVVAVGRISDFLERGL